MAFSRLYCGWLCPINTVLRAVPGKHGRASGEVRHGNLIRAASVLLLIAGIISTAAFGMGLPLLPAIVIIGIVVGLYDEMLFHSYLCPFGNIQRLVPGLGRRMTVDGEACVSCGACVGACPTAAIGLGDRAIIDQRECISCGGCEGICPERAIAYRK